MSVFWSSAATSLNAVGRTLSICCCGFVLARYRATAGGANSWRDFARLNAEFFTPCLVIASFSKGISPEILADLWPVIVLAFLLPQVWLVTGAVGARLLLPPDQHQFVRFAAVCVAYPNAFAIPYPLMRVLVRQVGWPTERPDLDAFSVSVTMLFSLCMLLQIWTVAFALYGQAAKDEDAALAKQVADESRFEDAADEAPAVVVVVDAAHSEDAADKGICDLLVDSLLVPGSFWSCCRGGRQLHAPRTGSARRHLKAAVAERAPQSTRHGDDRGPDAVDSADEDEVQAVPRAPSRRLSFSATDCVVMFTGRVRAVREVFNPLLVSLLVALGISLSPLREPFVASGVHDWLEFMGAASVPMVLIQLGAGMARPPAVQGKEGGFRWRSAFVVVFLRGIVANLIGSGIVTFFRHMGWLKDPYVILCMYLMCCSPTAANVSLVSSVQGAFVQPTAVTLFVMQAAAVPLMTVSIAAYVAVLS